MCGNYQEDFFKSADIGTGAQAEAVFYTRAEDDLCATAAIPAVRVQRSGTGGIE